MKRSWFDTKAADILAVLLDELGTKTQPFVTTPGIEHQGASSSSQTFPTTRRDEEMPGSSYACRYALKRQTLEYIEGYARKLHGASIDQYVTELNALALLRHFQLHE